MEEEAPLALVSLLKSATKDLNLVMVSGMMVEAIASEQTTQEMLLEEAITISELEIIAVQVHQLYQMHLIVLMHKK